MAVLGLLRALESAQPAWRARVRWSLDKPPLRPVLVLRQALDEATIAAAAAAGVTTLGASHDFAGRADLNYAVGEGRAALVGARGAGGYAAELASALLSDAAVKIVQGKPQDAVEATPFCLLFGQGHQHFLQRLADVPKQPAPPPRGRGKKAIQITEAGCLAEALFATWARQDPTFSFRWDPAEDVRYALMYGDPSNAANKEGTQHGANRLAAVGLSALTAVPIQRAGEVRLGAAGGAWNRGFSIAWPVWRDPIGLDAIRSLLIHPDLRQPAALARLGVDHVREARRISVGKFMNFTAARTIDAEEGAASG
ncbi:MAG TPA: hypothetical protein VHD15_07645 [Hyphomicrobiales bacterium]|nr:hypothetical protein [Hyphomicrobiales bacterium]